MNRDVLRRLARVEAQRRSMSFRPWIEPDEDADEVIAGVLALGQRPGGIIVRTFIDPDPALFDDTDAG